jgi:hypothetical protein
MSIKLEVKASSSPRQPPRVHDLAEPYGSRSTTTLHTFSSGNTLAAALGPDGMLFASGGLTGTVLLRVAPNGRQLFTFGDRQDGWVSAAFSRNGGNGYRSAMTEWSSSTSPT